MNLSLFYRHYSHNSNAYHIYNHQNIGSYQSYLILIKVSVNSDTDIPAIVVSFIMFYFFNPFSFILVFSIVFVFFFFFFFFLVSVHYIYVHVSIYTFKPGHSMITLKKIIKKKMMLSIFFLTLCLLVASVDNICK